MVVQFSGVSIAGIETSPPEKRIVLLPWPPRECRGNIWILHLQHLNVNSQDRAAAQINAGLELPLPDHRSNSRPRAMFSGEGEPVARRPPSALRTSKAFRTSSAKASEAAKNSSFENALSPLPLAASFPTIACASRKGTPLPTRDTRRDRPPAIAD